MQLPLAAAIKYYFRGSMVILHTSTVSLRVTKWLLTVVLTVVLVVPAAAAFFKALSSTLSLAVNETLVVDLTTLLQ